jgi:3-deoxy-D-manno-octulosonic-acid transferase
MRILYAIINILGGAFIQLLAPFSSKLKKFANGRKGLISEIQRALMHERNPVVWIHCASLGEFEQGRPIIEKIKREFPHIKILLTFFSPSGYEVRKNYNLADYVFYLPLDTPRNAMQFIDATKPILAIFVKYEFWYFYTKILKEKNIPTLSVSSIFRKNQAFFKWYGGFYRNILKNFDYFFVQNDTSLQLLRSIGIRNARKVGDTRFDRVHEIMQQAEEIPIAKKFKGNEKVMVVGSSWPEDIDVLLPLINSGRIKCIIAPHEIKEEALASLEKEFSEKHIRYSQADKENLEEYKILIIDNVGLLSRLYRYGEFAYIGGAFGKGLHNILEAACFGMPLFFGDKNYEKFQEAKDLIAYGGAFAVSDSTEMNQRYEQLNTPEDFMLACTVTKEYVNQNLGATEAIVGYCRSILKTYEG